MCDNIKRTNISKIISSISLQAPQTIITAFSKQIFKTMSFVNVNNLSISDSSLIQLFFNIPLPLAERIFTYFNMEGSSDFFDENQFTSLVLLIYTADIKAKVNFFLKIFSYGKEQQINKKNLKTMFRHINNDSVRLVKEFFGKNKKLTHSDAIYKIKDNCDIILFFYTYLFKRKRINDNVLNYYHKLSGSSKKFNQTEVSSFGSGSITNIHKSCIKIRKDSDLSPLTRKERSPHRQPSVKFSKRIKEIKLYPNESPIMSSYSNTYSENELNLNLLNLSSGNNNYCNDYKTDSKLSLNTSLVLNTLNDCTVSCKFLDYVHKYLNYTLTCENELDFPSMSELRQKFLNNKSYATVKEMSDDDCDDMSSSGESDLDDLTVFEKDVLVSKQNIKTIKVNKINTINSSQHFASRSTSSTNICRNSRQKPQRKSFKDSNVIGSNMNYDFMIAKETDNDNDTHRDINDIHVVKQYNTLQSKRSKSSKHNVIDANSSSFIKKSKSKATKASKTKIVNDDVLPDINEYDIVHNGSKHKKLYIIDTFFFITNPDKLFESTKHNFNKCFLLNVSFIKNIDHKTISYKACISGTKTKNHVFSFNTKAEKNQFLSKAGYRKIQDEYTFSHEIATGRFSKVYLALRRNVPYAIKVIPKVSKMYKEIQRETYINNFLMNNPHKNIIPIYEVYESAEEVYIIMEKSSDYILNEATLLSEQNQISYEHLESIISQLLEAVHFLHKRGIIHRDIQLSNILISNKEEFTINIIDFGLSCFLSHGEVLENFHFTSKYTAPEIIFDTPYSFPSDIWSVGVLAYLFQFKVFPIENFEMNQYKNRLYTLNKEVIETSPFIWDKNNILKVIRYTLTKSQLLRKKSKVLLHDIFQIGV